MKPFRLALLALSVALAACARAPEAPAPLPEPPRPPLPPQLATHPTADHTCVLDGLGALECWGRNDRGQLGTADRAAPRNRIAVDTPFVMVAVGGRHTCALAGNRVVWCWGANEAGQLGSGDSADASTPRRIASERRFTRLAAGTAHTCALDDVGHAFCWGENGSGQLGNDARAASGIPVAVATDASFQRLSAGSRHTCGVTEDARALCWGDNFLGQLGLPRATPGSGSPIQVPGVDSVASLTAGHGHTCALSPSGEAWCWGQNGIGQLGTGAPPGAGTAARVAGVPALAEVRAGYHHTCAIDVDGGAWCWGANTSSEPGAASISGQLGSDVSWTNLPARIEFDEPFASIAPGDGHTCALTRAGVVYCFGSNRFGQLGRPEPRRSLEPLRVLEVQPALDRPRP